MNEVYTRSQAFMGTVVTIEIVGHGTSQRARRARGIAVDRAMEWFRSVEGTCSRFDATSELRQLSSRIGTATVVSPLLFEAVNFALEVAHASDGAFDPTIGHHMERRGFNRRYQDQALVSSDVSAPDDVSFRDVEVDVDARTITLRRPLVLDLSAVAKGLAVDMASKTLAPFEDFVVDAGGDLFAGGVNAQGAPWSIGIPDPRNRDVMLDTVHVTNTAVCTSGNYERPTPVGDGQHHIMNPVTLMSPADLASVTVLAPTAMVADALATAAFVLGSVNGVAFLEAQQADGILFTSTGQRLTTRSVMHV